MGKGVDDTVFDAALDVIATGTKIFLCSAEPSTYAEATATFALNDGSGTATLTPGDGNGSFTIANGDVSGRKITLGALTAVPTDTTGVATHYAITVPSTLLHWDELSSSLSITSGNTVDVPAVDLTEMTDPT